MTHIRSHALGYSSSYCGYRDASGLVPGTRNGKGDVCSKCVAIRDEHRRAARARLALLVSL